MNNKSRNKNSTNLGEYGSSIFPEQTASGYYRLQTDYPALIAHMKQRACDSSSPWEMIGWGTSFIFRREFSGLYEAKRSARTIFAKLGIETEFEKLSTGALRIVVVAQSMLSHATPSGSKPNRLKSEKTPLIPGENRVPVAGSQDVEGSGT